MSKAIQGAAEIGLAGTLLALNVLVPGVGAVITASETSMLWGLLASGVATEATAIASAIGNNSGVGVTTRSAASSRQIIRGEQRVGGTIVYCSTTGRTERQYNMVIVLATHEIEAIVNLYLDGRQVFWDTSSSYNQTINGVNFGGNSDGNNHTGPNGDQYNFGGEVFCAAFLGQQNTDPTVVSGAWVGPSVWNDGDGPYPGFCSALQANDSTWSPSTTPGPGTASASCQYDSLGSGEIDTIDVDNPGFGYASGTVALTIIDAGGTGSGASGHGIASGGSITSFVVDSPGSDYSNPQVTVDPPSTTSVTPYLAGCAYVYLKIEADSGNFPQLPEIRFTVRGKNNIYDPRTGQSGYSTNWALHVADAITDSTWGLGDNSVNHDQLIAAANVCDEPVNCAAGEEARYSLHWHYNTSTSPGDALAQMMDAAGGRLSRIGGEWYIWPAYWQGPSFNFDANALAGPLQWTAKRALADLCNRVAGTYTAPNFPYNVAGDLYDSNGYWNGQTQNNFPFAFQLTSYPMYAADPLHGYGDDVYLTQDGGIVLPHELTQNCVLSISQAQRLAKIHLLRNRQQGSGTFPMSLGAWQAQPADVIEFNMPALGWANKVLEIVSVKFQMAKREGDDAPASTLVVGVQETDASVYEWDPEEELTAYDIPVQGGGTNTWTVGAPTSLAAVSDLATALVQPNGQVIPRIELTWTEPVDTYVQNGGSIEIQMCAHSSGAWQDVLLLGGQATQAFLGNVVSLDAYDVRIRSVRSGGAVSAWVELDNIVCGFAFSAAGLMPVAPAGTLGASSPINTSRFFTFNTSIITLPASFTASYAGVSVTCTPSTMVLTGLLAQWLYYVYYIDPGFVGGAITPIATLNPSDFFAKSGYFLIGSILTPPLAATTPRYLPTAFADIGATPTLAPTAAYDNNRGTSASVEGIALSAAEVLYLGFASVLSTSSQRLSVVYSVVNAGSSAAEWAITATLGGASKPPGALSVFNARGAWAATTAYAAWDTFTITTGSGFFAVTVTYLVVTAYTSGSSFGSTDVANTCVVIASGTGSYSPPVLGGIEVAAFVAVPSGLNLSGIVIDFTSNADASDSTTAFNQVVVTEIYIQ